MDTKNRHSSLVTTSQKSSALSYRDAMEGKDSTAWDAMAAMTLADACAAFLESLANNHTRRGYTVGLKQLSELGLIDPLQSLQEFAVVNHEAILDRIKLVEHWAEGTRQVRAALYCALTRFLARRTGGLVRRAMPSREGTTKTFEKVRDLVAADAMNREEWTRFLKALDKINLRDGLIARITLQGGKRISEVLSLQVDQIKWADRQITFQVSKTKGTARETIITYPQALMDTLKAYLDTRTAGTVFITRAGKIVHPTQLARSFAKAGERAGLPFKITPHTLRASLITYLRREGFNDGAIQKVTGHASSEMIRSYDKNGLADKPTAEVSLI